MNPGISYKKILKIAVAGLAIAVIAAEFYIYFHNKSIDSKIVIKEFYGIIKSIEGDELSVIGVYKSELEGIPRIPFSVKVLVGDDTKITRVELHYPPAEERMKNDGLIDQSKIRREEKEVSFDQMKADSADRDLGALFMSDSSVYQKTSFKASTIRYEMDVY